MITLVEKSAVFAPITQLRRMSNQIGFMAIVAMVVFCALLSLMLLLFSRRLANRLSDPIRALAKLTQNLGEHMQTRPLDPVGIVEVDDLGGKL